MNNEQINVALGRGQAVIDMGNTLLKAIAGMSGCWAELMDREPELMDKHADIFLRYTRLQRSALKSYDQAKARMDRLRRPSC